MSASDERGTKETELGKIQPLYWRKKVWGGDGIICHQDANEVVT